MATPAKSSAPAELKARKIASNFGVAA